MVALQTTFRATTQQNITLKRRIDMSCVGTVILGGGSGTRLHPLTLTRCKPAIPFGGNYRLIDTPMSNALNSGCDKIYILTQFLSASLHQHILKTYRMENHSQGFVEILSAEQKPTKTAWYQGTADAIRQNVEYLKDCNVDYFLILSGDQLYQMHFEEMLAVAEETDADLVVAALPIDEISAKRMGVLKVNEKGYIVDFTEKPQTAAALDPLRASPNQLEKFTGSPFTSRAFLGSMGIYLFKRKALLELLEEDLRDDFGHHLIPTQVAKGTCAAYVFPGYWEDIGTIESFYQANIALTSPSSPLNMCDEKFPIHTTHASLAPPRIDNALVSSSLLCEGSIVEASRITQSIIGPRSIIGKGTTIEASYLFGNDCYEQFDRSTRSLRNFPIGENCEIRKAIIDKQVKIGNNVKLTNPTGLTHFDKGNVVIRDGVILVTSGAIIPDNFTI